MSARRFFVEHVHASGDEVEIVGSDAYKIRNVLRLCSGDAVEVIDSVGHAFVATLNVERDRVAVRLGEMLAAAQAARLQVDVAQGLPKGQKMDFVVEKLTELGVASILPLQCERAVVRDVGTSKIERWRRLAKAGAQQCGRADIPTVFPLQAFDELIARFGEYDRILVAWELAPPTRLRDVLPNALAEMSRLLLVIGPEGGFAHAEVDAAVAAGALPISLGARILRTETAALVLLALVNYASD